MKQLCFSASREQPPVRAGASGAFEASLSAWRIQWLKINRNGSTPWHSTWKTYEKTNKNIQKRYVEENCDQLRMGGNQSKWIPRQSFPNSAYRLNMSALFTLTTDQTIWTPLIPESGAFGINKSKSKRKCLSIFEQVDASSVLSPATSLKISSKSHGAFKLVTSWNLPCIQNIFIILCSLLKAPFLLTIQLFLTSLCQTPKLRSQLWTPADRNLDEAEIPAASPNVFALTPRNSWSKQKQTQTTNQTLAFTEVFSYYPQTNLKSEW